MSQKIPSLKSILEKRLETGFEPKKKLSYDEYKSAASPDTTPLYAKGMREAYVSSLLDSRRGFTGERAHERGYLSSGYVERLGEKDKERLDRRLEKIEDEAMKEEKKAYTGYLSYLSDYEKDQKALSDGIKQTLIRKNVADPRAAYSYAISRGLDSESSKDVSLAVYEVMRNVVISSIAEKLTSIRLTEDGAVSLARGYGLIEEDVEFVRQLAKERKGDDGGSAEIDYGPALEEYLKELEKNADKLSSGK